MGAISSVDSESPADKAIEAVANTLPEPYQEKTSDVQPEVASVVDDEVPDGGRDAWLQVVGSFALYLNTWGLCNTFGVYQTYYQNDLLRNMAPSTISWIGSTQTFFLLVIGVFSGPLYDAGYLRLLLLMGAALIVIGSMMTSLCTQYWQVMLAQAVCTGSGLGLLYIPSLAIIPQWFKARRALAVGIVTSGSSLGGVIYSLLFQSLTSRIGFGWSVRVQGFISLATLSIGVSVLKRRTKGRNIRSLIDYSAFSEPAYLVYCVAMFLSYTAFFAPIFYLQSYALSHGMQDDRTAGYLVTILNATSVVGRLTPSLIAKKIGPTQTLFVSMLGTGICCLAWINTNSAAGNIAFAATFGFFSGGIVAMPSVVLASFTKDLETLGTRLGQSSLINALGSLVGGPIGGAILTGTGSYLGIMLFSGVMTVASALLLLLLRFVLTGRKLLAVA